VREMARKKKVEIQRLLFIVKKPGKVLELPNGKVRRSPFFMLFDEDHKDTLQTLMKRHGIIDFEIKILNDEELKFVQDIMDYNLKNNNSVKSIDKGMKKRSSPGINIDASITRG
jgi:hypothetical protein